MNLLQIRTKLIQISGRYDLVKNDQDWVDNGANFYINSGFGMLDRKMNTKKSVGKYFEEVASSAWYITMPNCRSIKNVWINNTTGRSELDKKDLIWLRNEYPSLISTTDTGTPLYYAPTYLRSVGDDDKDSLGEFFSLVMDDSENYSGLIFLPPPDESLVVEVWGTFMTPELSADADENYWSIEHPMLSLFAALYYLEVSYRNTEGANDWNNAMTTYLTDLDKDTVEEEIHDADHMEG